MAVNDRFGLRSCINGGQQQLLCKPIFTDTFSYDTCPVEDFLVDKNPKTLTSLVMKYYIPIAEIEINVPSDKKSLVQKLADSFKDPSSKASLIFGISSEPEDIEEYLIHSGSSREDLFLPSYQIRADDGASATEVDPYESADLDVMIVLSQPLICKPVQPTELMADSDCAALSSKVQLVMDNSGCHLGFTRILVEGDAGLLPKQLKDAISCCEDGNYLSSEVLLASLYKTDSTKFENTPELFKKGELTRQGPAINMKVLDDHDSVKSVVDIDCVPTFKCNSLPKELLSWQKRIQTRRWPPEDIRPQLFQKPCYVVGAGYHGSPNKDIEWRFSTSAIENVLGSSITLVQRKCYMLFKILHKTALKEIKLLATYHLKNILFEALEETEVNSTSMWTEVNLMPCLCFLLDKLISHLEKGRVMSYFIDGYNLIDHYPPESIQQVLEKVKTVRKSPLKYLMLFDFKFAFDFSRNKIFQDDFEPYFKLYDQDQEDYQLLAHSVVMSLIRHAHSDISTNDVVLYNRAFALLEDCWKIMNAVNPEFNGSKSSFMSDVTLSGIEVQDSRKFQEFLSIKFNETLEITNDAKEFASMLGLPTQAEANPISKLLSYRMVTLESFCEAKEFDASGLQVTNAQIYAGTEPQILAITGTMLRAMLKITLWISKIYSASRPLTPEELQRRKACVSMEIMKEVTEIIVPKKTGDDSTSTPAALTEIMSMFPKLELDDSLFEGITKLNEMLVPKSKDSRDNTTAKLLAYELLIQFINGSLDVNLYFVSSYNTLFLFLMFGMKKDACRMLVRLNPSCLWVGWFLNAGFLSIGLKQLNRYVSSFVLPAHLISYIDSVRSCEVKIKFIQYYLLIECSTANPGFFEVSEVEQALASATKFVQELNIKPSKQHYVFLLSVMNFKLDRFVEAGACLESIVSEVDGESKQVVEETLTLYQCLQMSLGQ